jgi:hypothetical protein
MRPIDLVSIALIALLSPANAAEDGCEKFAWPLTRERVWFSASDKASVRAGDSLAAIPGGAFTLKLQPASEASFALQPERKPRTENWFGGLVRLPSPERGGLYQVTVSDEAWIDIVQNERYARSVGSTGRNDCPGMRKSVRLELGPAPFVVQLSAVTTPVIIMAISRVE